MVRVEETSAVHTCAFADVTGYGPESPQVYDHWRGAWTVENSEEKSGESSQRPTRQRECRMQGAQRPVTPSAFWLRMAPSPNTSDCGGSGYRCPSIATR